MNESVEISVSESPVKTNRTALWRNIAFLLGGAVLLFMIYTIGIDQIWANVRQTGWWFLAIIGVWGVVYLINTIAWYAIIHEDESVRIPFYRVMQFTVSGYALNYVTPMGLAGGEPYRIMELRRYMPTEKATASVILYAMMHVCSHFFFWLSAAVLVAWYLPVVPTALSIALTVMASVSIALIFLFFKGYREGLVVKLFKILGKLPLVGKKVRNLKPETQEKLILIDTQIRSLRGKRKKAFYFSLGMEFLARVVSCLEILFILLALGQQAIYLDAFIVVALSSLFANILFFSPMQMGTREGGIFLAFKTLGITPGLSVSVSMITRIRELFWIMMGILIMKLNFHNKE
ncbi:MAG: lysylphosphatidylglycerol synthase transmembrane domain-containing protein [Bacteroidales bacterium]